MTAGGLAAPGARAVLYGTGSHADGSELPALSSVDTTLDALERTLTDVCGMDPAQVVRVPAHAGAAEVVDAVEEATTAADGPVLFYYVGHGLLGPRDDLYLATRDSRSARHVARSVSYRTVRDLLGVRGDGSLVVLDCCFSGRGDTPPAEGGVRRAFATAGPRGSFLLSSASHYALSFAPEGERYTLFSGRLLGLLNQGDPAGPPWLTADRLHAALDASFADDARVNPARRSEGTLGSLVLARNRAYRPPPAAAERPAELPCPYPGLEPYRAQDSAHFFGREDLTDRLIQLVEDLPDGGQAVLVGASGAGKSSLLRAGLLARTASTGPALLLPAPGPRPFRALAEAWAAATERDPEEVREELEGGRFPTPSHGLPACRLLVVDQFEELFTRCELPDERAAFIALLTGGEPGPGPRIVLGLRADHYGSCLEHPGLERALARAQLSVPPLRERELRAVVERPAVAVGMTVEPGLTDRLLHDLHAGRSANDAATALPFLAHALRETWRGRSGAMLTLAGYQATRGIWQSVATATRRVYESLDDDGRTTMRRLLLSLVHLPPDGGAPVLRHRVPLDALPPGSDTIRDQLARERLLTADQDTAQIAHEALLRAWPLLREWIREDAAVLLLRQQLSSAAREWQAADRDAAFLYRESRLQTVAALDELPALEQEFLKAGQAAATDELRRERRRTTLLKRALTGVAVALCLALVAVVVAVQQQRTAQRQQRTAVARALLAEANGVGTSDPRAALRLGLAAHALRPSSEARRSLFDTLAGSAFRGVSEVPARIDPVLAPGGRMLAARDEDEDGLTVWDTGRDPVPRTPSARPACPAPRYDTEDSVTFGGPGGRMLAAVCGDGEVRLWNLVSKDGGARPLATLRARGVEDATDGPTALALSTDGKTLAAIGLSRSVGRGAIVLWDVSDPRAPRQLPFMKAASPPDGSAQDDRVAFSPDGRLLATADTYGDVRLWDVSDPRGPRPRGTVKGGGGALAFRPDGELLAVSRERVIALVDVRDPGAPKVLGERTAHSNLVSSLDFSPGGRKLVSGGWDRSVALWDVTDTGEITQEARLYGHAGFVDAARYDADGGSVVSVSYGEVIHRELSDVPLPHVLDVLPDGDELALAADGTTLAVARGSRIALWDLSDPSEPRRLARVDNPVEDRYEAVGGGTVIGTGDVLADLDFSSDGRLLAAMNHDREVTLWDVSDPARPRVAGTLSGAHEGALNPTLDFAPDRPLLAVNDLEGVGVWDVSDPALPALTASTVPGLLQDVVFAPDGRRLLLVKKRLDLWDMSSDTTTPLSEDTDLYGGVRAAFSPHGDVVAAVSTVPSDNSQVGVDLWNAAADGGGETLGRTEPIDMGQAYFTHLAFDPDGRLLAGAGEDGAVRLWSVADPEQPYLAYMFSGHRERVDEVVLAGRTMITTSADVAYVTDLGAYPELAADAVGIACRATGGGFTREEWEKRVPEEDFVKTCPDNSDK
ncbi:caspase, EACC1-associated type [Streptomyces edwardsiae]|uniref:Caspase family protein n=1 Tax=Streptomyces edwardsiae TaxID=3075527 RepID=A0ABU2QBZ3_9ACTN|nr:caspase family protein [Streptomyces sp. DSM 41635]MDT0401961.1 caspase family protein [Streptomyces sp. DSM 41635]